MPYKHVFQYEQQGLDGAVAVFSEDMAYRFYLWKPAQGIIGQGRETVLFILLNPSTADAFKDDPTVRRCRAFGRAWGNPNVMVVNLFALRATDPKELYRHNDPIGSHNDFHILAYALTADRVVCAWGNHGDHLQRADRVETLLREHEIPLYHLGLTKRDQPRHPLYSHHDLRPILWA